MTDNESIVKPTKMPSFGMKKGIAANRAMFEQNIKQIDPKTVPNRLGLVIDDSGSMGHQGMEDAHKAIQSFTQSCNAQDTSISVYPLNAGVKPLTCDFDLIMMYVNGIWATGGTPIYSSLDSLIEKEPITRAVLFSDGSPTDSHILVSDVGYSCGNDSGELAKKVVAKYVEKKISIDTISIGTDSKELQKLAELTGGTYIRFKDTASLSSGLKYLAPKYRALLSNPEVKARIERGETI